jgi:hypothetical protein
MFKIRSHATAADAQLTVLANWVEEQVRPRGFLLLG